jgi:AAA domain
MGGPLPPDRRRRRFRRPGTGRWLTESLPTLRIELASQVRATLTAWMRLYGEANNVRGLATGPIETRFARLRQTVAADTLIVWTTPSRWAAGEGLSLRFPQLHLEFTCALGDGHLVASKVAQVPEDARPPDREPGAVGVVVRAERIPLPPEDADELEPDPGVDALEQHFARLAGRRWGGFAAPLRAALEAEAKEDEARTQRLTVPFKDASMTRSGEEDTWRLKGVPAEALRALDDGEWLEVLDEQGRSRTSARVIDTHPSAGSLVIGVRTASDPPRTGFIRPRSRRKILEQKRALLEELASPTGSLPNLVRLVAAPASMPAPHAIRPMRFVNPAVVRNRSQARAVSLALGLEEGQALLLQGPPGTGKSTTAAEIDVQLILRDPGVRILVCSHSNHGTDNMLMKVLPFLEDADERIARIGFYERIAREARPFYAAADADLGDRNIIFTTIDALVLQDIAGARVYDYVLLDEANRAGVLDSLLALARGKRMILVGDPMQLQPVMSEAEQQIVAQSNGRGGGGGRRPGRQQLVGVAQPGANNVIGKSLFAWIQERRFAPAATVLLDQQNRMHPAIGELVSRVFYSGRVRTGPAAPRRGTGLPVFPSPVTWVDTRSLRGNVESRAGGTSLFNVAEARLVTSITRHLAAQAPPNLTIGVITAYAEQRDLLRRLMGPHDLPPERQLEIDTVDAFEGREKDIIVLSLVRANRRRDIGFLRLEQRLNVAVSRSRRLIIIVGDTSTLRQGYFHHLVATAQSVGHIVPAPKLIGQLLHRGRRLRDRDERRREGVSEELQPVGGAFPRQLDGQAMSAFEGDAQGFDADAAAAGDGHAADGQAADDAAADDRIVPFRRGPDLSPSGEPGAGPGSEAGAGSSMRRRRRRAWERRRDRMRQLAEQQRLEQLGEADPSTAPGSIPPRELEVPSAPTPPSPDEVAVPVARRGRRRRPEAVASVQPTPSESPQASEPAVTSQPATGAEPAALEPAAQSVSEVADAGAPVEVAPRPARARRRSSAGSQAEPLPSTPEAAPLEPAAQSGVERADAGAAVEAVSRPTRARRRTRAASQLEASPPMPEAAALEPAAPGVVEVADAGAPIAAAPRPARARRSSSLGSQAEPLPRTPQPVTAAPPPASPTQRRRAAGSGTAEPVSEAPSPASATRRRRAAGSGTAEPVPAGVEGAAPAAAVDGAPRPRGRRRASKVEAASASTSVADSTTATQPGDSGVTSTQPGESTPLAGAEISAPLASESVKPRRRRSAQVDATPNAEREEEQHDRPQPASNGAVSPPLAAPNAGAGRAGRAAASPRGSRARRGSDAPI